MSNKNKGRDQLAQIIYDTINGQYGDFNMPDDAADAIVNAGWRPPARTVTTVEEAEALPDGTVVLDSAERVGCLWWHADPYGHGFLALPATVLWEPEEGE